MNENIESYKQEIEECKNTMLNEYTNLLTCYEESRQLYENALTTTASVQKCSEISAKNGSATLTKWSLINLKGTTIYTTDRYASRETCVIDLTKKSMVPGSQFRLKAIVTVGDDDTSEIILEYDPEGPIAKFVLRGSTFKTDLVFEGTVDRTV